MSSLVKTALRQSIAQGIYNEIVSKRSRYYNFLGKVLKWSPLTSADTPELPVDTIQYENEIRNNIISMKQINNSDISLVVPRYDWAPDVVYDMYDDTYSVSNPAYSGATSIQSARFYVVNIDYNVYKCISNNYNSLSTISPFGNDTDLLYTSDGYVWKYMYNIPIALRNKFLTSAFIPVTTGLKNQFYSAGEINTVNIINGGSGYKAIPTLNVSGDGYVPSNPFLITSIPIVTRGAGYTSAPVVTIAEPNVDSANKTNAIGTAILGTGADAGKVVSIRLDDEGYGYDVTPTVTIAPPVNDAITFLKSTSYALNAYVVHENNYYEVTEAGTTGIFFPTHTSGSAANGDAELTYVGTRARASAQASKNEAKMHAVLSNGTTGEIINVIIDDAGIGYTEAIIDIVGGNPDINAELVADLSTGDLNTIQANVELLATNGSIDYIKVVNGGSGYNAATVTITGDGTGATATAVIQSGVINKINITNYGLNYTKAIVSITGDGTGANVRAIIGPYGGHGKNAENELYARSLMLFTSVSSEKNKGFSVENDFRQFGIIRNPDNYESDGRLSGSLGSACYKVIGAVNLNYYSIDMELTDNSTGAKYIIVALNESSMLLQAVDNQTCSVNQVLQNSLEQKFTVVSFETPDLNKFSGEMFYVDNRAAFTPSAEQTITTRTVIQF